jgi:uncharacterized protein (TIGR02001 family)
MSAPPAASAELSANVTLTSDYILRGVSQTEERPALQAGVDVVFDNGIYLGAWGSTVDFDEVTGGTSDAWLEADYYAGYGAALGDSGWSYRVGAALYDYRGDSGFDFHEILASVSRGGFTASLYYSPEYIGEDTTALVGEKLRTWYTHFRYSHPLPREFTLTTHIGHTAMSTDGAYEPSGDSYSDWSLGLSREWVGVALSLTYYDTDLGDLYGGGFPDGGARLVFAIGKVF